MERVLVVDDEPQVLVAMEDLLSDEFAVLTSASPADALNLASHNEDLAVVISDERMPEMPGGELLARIRDTSNARRILVTGFADLTAVVRAVNEGRIFAYVTKPWDSSDLKQKVQQAAEQFRLVREVTSEQQLLHDLMDNIPEGIYFKDRQLRIRAANAAFAAQLGVQSSEALVGKTIEELRPDLPHLGESRREEEAILVFGAPAIDVIREYPHRGGQRWLSESKAPIRGPEGRVLGLVGISRDVSERVLMEDSLRESEARLSRQTRLLDAILNSMRDAVVAADQNGQFVLFNRRARQLFDAPLFDQSADSWARSQPIQLQDQPGELSDETNPLLRAIRGERTDETPVHLRTDGASEATLTVTGTPLLDSLDKPIGGLALVRDVTRKRLLQRQLAQAQKMEAIGQLAGGVAHDFNNLLSVIMGYGGMLREELRAHDSAREDMDEILAAADRGVALTRQLLSISRRQVVTQRVVLLDEVVGDLEKMLRRVIGEDIELVTDLAPSLAPIAADVGQLEQVLLNLTVNARDAMPAGGSLRFETRNVTLTQARDGRYSHVPAGSYAKLTVTDTGEGMSSETLKRAFEPFFTTKEVGRGTGLGLATVYGIVQQSGGHIEIGSELGRGTSFEIYLPVAEGQPTSQRRRPSSRPPRAASTATILLVEDDDAVRQVSGRILRARGHRVLEASLPSEALRLARQHAEGIDLLMADIVMPEMSGPELARQLSESRPSLTVLFITGYSGEAVSGTGALCIQKPFSPYSLADKVREVLEESAG